MQVISQGEAVTFKSRNFHPDGELVIFRLSDFALSTMDSFDHLNMDLPNVFEYYKHFKRGTDLDSQKILRNLPFAIRGHSFKTKLIREYYQAQHWYTPDPDYKANTDDLTAGELKWLEAVRANNNKY